MPIKVLIIEDAPNAGSLVFRGLQGQLGRLAHHRVGEGPTSETGRDVGRRDAGGRLHEFGGHLGHLCPAHWPPFDNKDFDVCLLDVDLLPVLRERAGEGEVELRSGLIELCRDSLGWIAGPHILIADLALSDEETEELRDAGGDFGVDGLGRIRDASGDLAMDEDAGPPVDLMDPREALHALTGFRLLQAVSGEIPVITTTYARNPLIELACVANGASAIVVRPLPESSETNIDFTAAEDIDLEILERNAFGNQSPLEVLLAKYVLAVAAEVLKAVSFVGHAVDDRDPLDHVRKRLGAL